MVFIYILLKTRSKENWITSISKKYSSTNSTCVSCNKYDTQVEFRCL